MVKITVCLDCTNRQLGCHSSCKKYLAQKTIIELSKRKEREYKKCYKDFMGYITSERGNMKKYKKK